MSDATTLRIIQEKYYAKLWIGDGEPPTQFWDPVAKKSNGNSLPVEPQLGWFYIDATTGKFYIYNGTDWTDTEEKWTGGFL